MKFVDLHVHTIYSDGLDTPAQVVKIARLNGLDALAIADHDSLAGFFEAHKEAKRWGVELVPAVEISTIQHHLLCLGFKPNDSGFRRFVDHSREIQEEVSEQRLALLRGYGVPITMEKVKRIFPVSAIGKYSIAIALLSDRACRDYITKRYGPTDVDGVFSLFLLSKGPAGHVEKRRVVTWEEAVDAVHLAGGLAIFAHPITRASRPDETRDLLQGIDGIEAQPKFGKKNVPFTRYAADRGLFLTYGSDYHGSALGAPILGRGRNQIDNRLLDRFMRYARN